MDDILKYQTLNLFLCISVEAFIFMNKWDPIYHLLPLACMILLPTLRRAFSGAAADAYIVDFSCFRPPPSLRVPTASFLEHLTLIDGFGRESVDFMAKVMAASGIGEETSLPPALRYLPPKTQHGDSVAEAEMLLFTALDELLRKTRISGKDIDVLVVNCSGFCPAPSLTSLIVNRFSFRDDVKTFNLSGMGCSASIIGIDIARGILKTGGGSFAVVVSTEILSTGWYSGRDRRKLLLNCSFRTGSAAVLLTNRREVRSKYHVADVVRTQLAHDDTAYRSAIREEDEEGETGVTIEREIPRVARDLLRVHAGAIGRRLLPAREKIRSIVEKFWKRGEAKGTVNFGRAAEHFCVPASGIEGDRGTEAAIAAFRRFGNQSSAGMWYQLAYEERKGRVKEGERVWMLGMGSGPKANSAVLRCVRNLAAEGTEFGPWGPPSHRRSSASPT